MARVQATGALSFLQSRAIEHSISDGTVERKVLFYPVSVRKVLALRDIGAALAKALNVLFGSKALEDFTRITRNFEGGIENHFQPPEHATLKFRAEQRNKAIDEAFACVMHEDNQRVIASLISDSLREEHDVLEYDADIYPQLVMGLLKANKRILGPLMERFQVMIDAAKTKLASRLDDLGPDNAQTRTSENNSSNTSSKRTDDGTPDAPAS